MSSSDLLGFHISVANTLLTGLEYAISSNIKSVQFFAGNNRSSSIKFKTKYTDEDKKNIHKYIKTHDMKVFIHGVYVINLCSNTSTYIHDNILHDLELAHDLGAIGVIVHLGSAVDKKYENAINNLVSNIVTICDKMATNIKSSVKLILETNSGQGNQVGVSIKDFYDIYSQIPQKYHKNIGICIDTAHIAAAGYHINTMDGIKSYLDEFDKLFGLQNISLIHLNDNPYTIGSRRDVHEIIGNGVLFKTKENLKALEWFLKQLIQKKIPIVLETSGAGKEGSTYPTQIEYLRKLLV